MLKVKNLILLSIVTLLIILIYNPVIAPSIPPHISINGNKEKLVELLPNKPLSKAEIWAETGATVLPLAANIMRLKNPDSQDLTNEQKKLLRPFFGEIVDQVRIFYNAQLMDRWSTIDQEIHIGGIDSAAQTYGLDIYIRSAYQPQNKQQLILLSHELVHVQQYLKSGDLGKFGYEYFLGYYNGGKKYDRNPLELAAKAVEKRFAQTIYQG